MYGLPRKFNIAFDGGGRVPVLEDTNDIGFAAVRVDGRRRRSSRASISACSSAASPATTTSPATPASCSSPRNACSVAGAVVRVFIDHGDRTDRKRRG